MHNSSFGPLLTDSTTEMLPTQDVIRAAQYGNDIWELGGMATGVLPENKHGGSVGQNDTHSVRSCGSPSTVHTRASEPTASESLGYRTAGDIRVGEEKHRQRRGRQISSKHPDYSTPVGSMHFEGHLLHRVCGVTGKHPLRNHTEASDDDQSDCSLLEDSGEDQLMKLRRNPVIMSTLVQLKALSLSAVSSSPDLGDAPGSQLDRGEAPGRAPKHGHGFVRFAQQEYLRLFEEMLFELLKSQRDKSKVRRLRGSYCCWRMKIRRYVGCSPARHLNMIPSESIKAVSEQCKHRVE